MASPLTCASSAHSDTARVSTPDAKATEVLVIDGRLDAAVLNPKAIAPDAFAVRAVPTIPSHVRSSQSRTMMSPEQFLAVCPDSDVPSVYYSVKAWPMSMFSARAFLMISPDPRRVLTAEQ